MIMEKKNKRKTFAEGLFSEVGWLPENWQNPQGESEQPVEKKDPSKLTKDEALHSMKRFSDQVLGQEISSRAVLKDIELTRNKPKAHYQCLEKPELKKIEDLWKDYPWRLEQVRACSEPKVVVIVNEFLQDKEGAAYPLFKKEEKELFHRMIQAMGLSEKNIWVSACSAGETPLEDEAIIQSLHLELGYFNPLFVMSLGALATQFMMQKKVKLSLVQGEFFEYTVEFPDKERDFTFMPLFHPEFLLINPNMKRKTWEGMKKLMARL